MQLGRRTIALIASGALALVGTVGLVAHVRRMEAKALGTGEAVRVLVAAETVPAGVLGGNALSNGTITVRTMPRSAVPEGAITSADDVKDKTTVAPILKGEAVLGARFAAQGAAHGLLPIPPDRQAMSVEVDVPPGVAGFVQPGDKVSIVAQIETPAPGGTASQVRYLLQAIPVLSVGDRVLGRASQDDAETQVEQTQKVLMTLALTPDEVEKLAFAILDGKVYFTLLPPDQAPAATGGRTRQNAFS